MSAGMPPHFRRLRARRARSPPQSAYNQRVLKGLRAAAWRRPPLAGVLVLTAAYVIAGKLGLRLAFVTESTTAVWPAAGIAVGALLVWGARLWPAVAAGAFLVNVTTSGHAASAAAIAMGNTAEALLAWVLVTRWASGVDAFAHSTGVFRFASLAGLIAPVAAATIGTGSLVAAGLVPPADTMSVWITWWIGDGVSILLVAPLVVMWSTRPFPDRRAAGWLELAGALLVVAAAGWFVFGPSPAGARRFPVPFIAVPVLLWPAFRLGARETAAATTLLAGIAIAGTLQEYGPFVRESPNASLLFVQAFAGTWMTAMLAVSIEVESRSRAERHARALNETLERRVAERTGELTRLHERLALAQRVANVGSWEWDVGRDTIWWSDELFRIFRLEPVAERTYESYLMLLHPDDRPRVESAVGKALADGRPFAFEHRLLWPDGTVRTVQANGQVELDASGRTIRMIGTARDVTELRLAEEERMRRLLEQAARVEAEDANRAKDEFLATLSHELRTPLNAALGWTFMLRDMPEDPAARGRAVDAIMRNLQVQNRLVSDMMDVSHITLRTLRLEKGLIDLRDVVCAAIESARDPAASNGLRIESALPPGPVHVSGDFARLQQVVWNLLSNAAKFAGGEGAVQVRLRLQEKSAELIVEDDGPGIDPEFLPQLFQRFRQADSSVRRRHGGLGLGLAIARHLVEAHEGTIVAANRPGGGAVFTVTLPCAATELAG
jgi:signal transduction histidine kinase